ncbi:MAG: crossover junction endodeoxyribonuclease RuvC [Thermoguttaceae bacterium]|nr:crossover junction endodeoxyribonuclease RuvC [Thermoguttaceae bacterium]
MGKVERIILGIDPGLNVTGYGVLDISSGRAKLLEAGVVRSSGKTLSARIKDIYDGVVEVIKTHRPDVLALEQLYSLYKRPQTAILMGHARGAICLAAEQSGVEVVSYAATKIKKTMTGAGRAPKDQIQRAVQMELRLPRLPEPPDVADAIAIAFCHYTEARQTQQFGSVFTPPTRAKNAPKKDQKLD